MKKLLAILLTLLMILSLAACGAAPEAPAAEPEAPAEEEFEEPAADPNGRIAATEYTYDCTEEGVVIENQIFSEPVTLNVQAGSTVQLLNCVFEQDVTYNGTSGSIVVFDEGCGADYYGVSCDYLLGRSPEPSGNLISAEEVPAPEQIGDNKMGSSVLATLNKKLIANSLNILFDLLAKSGNHELLKLVSDSLFLNVYALFRLIFSANEQNNAELFKLSKKLYTSLAPAAMLRDQAYIRLYLSEKDSVNSDKLAITTESLSKEYPLFASSLLNLVKNAELSLEELSKNN